ncbi:hypothetical protein CHLNCDRAFT_143265 [Chlorella variabilis]|uniref:DUF711 domain-containing protein n=1 Tax=Chlorella variabilis TaxID=554065 RepID=E1Z9U5_CHLVA|nr:hypothetical protein CHLNCDRAFT_143265 [Chlorella variabilis]EFN57834.1 hypothetical protein CHLNCDRAFT_143265 [Chlorella variabilis]|eukprot:XP_005849936.1 hypothetical protein CHLNCDRAFT_143265 [Chlorella variabilis]
MAAGAKGFRIRTVSYFVSSPQDKAGWNAEIAKAAVFLKRAQVLFESHGYEVQTVRIVTHALSAAQTGEEAAETAAMLERLCLTCGISFLSLGCTSDESLLEQGCFSKIAACTRYTSCSFSWQPGMGQRQAQQLAAAIHGLAEQTAGAGNFRFGVGFNCHPGIPFFPVAASAADVSGFAIGTENSGLLFRAFQQAVADSASTTAACSVLAAAQRQLQAVMTAALQPVQELAEQLAAAHGQPYLGIDASIAPALEPPSIPAAYELLGLGRFGGSGTLAISERITAALKSLPIKLCGYSGLMLPVCEDSGLAQAADERLISVGSLLHYSAVCGCGLDTVPVPGATQGQPAQERQALLGATAALLLDVSALAFRLDKPLSVRLLPVPGASAGQQTAFDSPYLLNCATLALD